VQQRSDGMQVRQTNLHRLLRDGDVVFVRECLF
jgi:hypothetical protein